MLFIILEYRWIRGKYLSSIERLRKLSTTIFKEGRPRTAFMDDLTKIIIKNRLHCFCSKYPKASLFEPTKILKKFNNEIINFEKVEFQALFYYLIKLNTYLRDTMPQLLKRETLMYFDRKTLKLLIFQMTILYWSSWPLLRNLR